ncbi:hypothetical protein H0H93_013486 [Arthromyces matolae]|nr:hypothetical protein H0H93_013486 [Arthromyces matolae]
MHPRRVLSTVTVACLLATLVSVQLTVAHPIHGQTLPNNLPFHNPASAHDPSRSIASTSEIHSLATDLLPRNQGADKTFLESISPSQQSVYLNNVGQRRFSMDPYAKIWNPAEGYKPIDTHPAWLDFEITNFALSLSPDVEKPRLLTIANLKQHQDELRAWLTESDHWLLGDDIQRLQREILSGLQSLTMFDLQHSSADGYMPQILRRMLIASQMHEAPLASGLESDIQSSLRFYNTMVRSKYRKAGYDLRNYKTLTLRLKSDLRMDK